MKVHYSSKTNEWSTPQAFFDQLDSEFKFTLDPCSNGKNNKCDLFFTEAENGLLQDWRGHTVFMNPPYGRGIKNWIEKAHKEGLKPNTTVVALIPARTDTKCWHEWIFDTGAEIRFIKGRLKFGDAKDSAPFPSAVIVFKSRRIK